MKQLTEKEWEDVKPGTVFEVIKDYYALTKGEQFEFIRLSGYTYYFKTIKKITWPHNSMNTLDPWSSMAMLKASSSLSDSSKCDECQDTGFYMGMRVVEHCSQGCAQSMTKSEFLHLKRNIY